MGKVDITKASGQWGKKKPLRLSKTGVGDQLKIFKTYKRKDITGDDAAGKNNGWHQKFEDAIAWLTSNTTGIPDIEARMKKSKTIFSKSRKSTVDWLNDVLGALESERDSLVTLFDKLEKITTVFNQKLAIIDSADKIPDADAAGNIAKVSAAIIKAIKEIDRSAPNLVKSEVKDALAKLNEDTTALKKNYDAIAQLRTYALQRITIARTKL